MTGHARSESERPPHDRRGHGYYHHHFITTVTEFIKKKKSDRCDAAVKANTTPHHTSRYERVANNAFIE